MKKKYNIATLMLATSLFFAGCANDNTANEADETTDTAVVEETTDETTNEDADTEVVEVEEETTEEETAEDEATEEDSQTEDELEENADSEAEEEEDETASETDATERNLVLHRAYPDEAGRSFANVVVATSGDKIVKAFIDEYQYYDDGTDYKAVPNSDKAFGEGTADGKILGSKIDNNEVYSAEMKEAGGEITLLDNYNAITDFVAGKTIAELEELLNDKEDEEILDAVSGATFKATPKLIDLIVQTAKDDSFLANGEATNPEDIELRYAIGAPHGDKSFGNAVVAVEGDKIIAASIDEYQYIEEGITKQTGEDSDFAKGYKETTTVLASKLENDEFYSKLMADKAESTVSLKDNFAAIEDFVAGKTIEEIKEVIASATPGETVEAVSGATLVDTVGYLQLIVDAAENNINVQ